MPPKLYGGGKHPWRRPARCDCDKIPYRDETAALAAADKRGEDAGIPLRVYKCPGSTSWHLGQQRVPPAVAEVAPPDHRLAPVCPPGHLAGWPVPRTGPKPVVWRGRQAEVESRQGAEGVRGPRLGVPG